MTRKHFRALAAIIKGEREVWKDANEPKVKVAIDNIQGMLTEFCKQENPEFDQARFYDACQI